ncbi:hypothetical protein V8F33_012065 [Rhypophila sp. PSN 637]
MCRPSSGSSTGTSGSEGVGSGIIPASVRALMPNHPACAEALSLAKASLPPSILYHSFRVFLYAQALMRIFQDDPEENLPSPHPTIFTAPLPRLEPGKRSGLGISEPPASPRRPPPSSIPPFPEHILFVGCILHDIGTAPQYDSIPERFEVVGADVAVPTNTTILTHQALQSQQIKDLWLALSLHTSPGIAERMGGVVRVIRLAVRADFGSYPVPDLNFKAEVLGGELGAGTGNGLVNVIKWGLPRLEIEKELGDAVVRQALGDRRKAPAASWPGDLVRAWEEDPDAEGVNKGF